MFNLEIIREKLEKYKRLLVNFTRRNKELYFKHSRSAYLNLSKPPKLPSEVSSDARELYFKKFSPIRMSNGVINEVLSKGKLDLSDHYSLKKFNLPEIEKQIDKVRLSDNKYQREFGISGAWLLGPFLGWHLSSEFAVGRMAITPIFKLPIDIDKSKTGKFTLILEEEGLTLNPTLRQYFKDHLGVILPECIEEDTVEKGIEFIINELEKLEIETVFASPSAYKDVPTIPRTHKTIKNEDGEIIERVPFPIEEQLNEDELWAHKFVTNRKFLLFDVFYVDQINASKMALLNDYNEIMESGESHPILQEMLMGQPESQSHSKNSRVSDKDLDCYKENLNHFVMDTDSSQHRAMERVSKERAVVIEGPPGTGKSQTITNMIANLVAEGKTVLFVSEKRAALDVVYSRLVKTNLDSKAALIHSSDLDRSDLYGRFIDAYNKSDFPKTTKKWDQLCEELDHIKSELNTYTEAVTSEVYNSGLAVSDMLTLYADLKDVIKHEGLGNFASQRTFEELELLGARLDELEILVSRIENYNTHPWLWKKAEVILADNTLTNSLNECSKRFSELCYELKNIDESSHKINDGLNYLKLIEKDSALSSVEVDADKSPYWQQAWDKCNNKKATYKAIIGKLKNIIPELQDLLKRVAPLKNGVDIEVVKQVLEYYRTHTSIWRWFTANYRKHKSLRATLFKNPKEEHDLQLYVDAISFFEKLSDLDREISLLGVENIPSKTEFSKSLDFLIELNGELNHFSKLFSNLERLELIPIDSSYSTIVKNVLQLKNLLELAKGTRVAIEKVCEQIDSYFDKKNDWSFEEGNFERIVANLVSSSKDIESLDRIDITIRKIAQNFNCDDLKELIVNSFTQSNGKWSHHLTGQAVHAWHDKIRIEQEALRLYDRGVQKQRIFHLKSLMKQHKTEATDVVHTKAEPLAEKADDFGISLLEREANKQRRVLSPREIMEKGALNAMLAIKPIWLMSPLSISQILPNSIGLFEFIIFDEASQVRMEDAIPSIYRAKKMVVVGDKKQMPPTTFFSSAADTLEEDDEVMPESVLDIAALIYPSEMLSWHYRSQTESLIAFSNRAFYGGRLISAPTANIKEETGSISFDLVENGVFKQKEGNKIEANIVVDRLSSLIKSDPYQSLGIIAMGVSQQKAIEEAIDERCQVDEEFRRALDIVSNLHEENAFSGLFVKNLENCQGDERDTILISIGYAPSSPGGKLRKHFGPLSTKGGGRRLNVAITRARKKNIVFCSFDPDILETGNEEYTRNPDATTFGRYLQYCKSMSENMFDKARSILDTFPVSGVLTTRKSSRFALDVKNCLERLGYKVVTEVGSSGYFIDLAVQHPSVPNFYVLGIECDGFIFHQYRRDKDIARQHLLETRGWKIERVDSIEWSKNREAEIERLDRHLKQLIHQETKVEEVEEESA